MIFPASRRSLTLALFLALAAILPARAADPVTIRAAEHDKEGFGRIVFDWPAPVTYDAKIDGEILTIHFARPIAAKLDTILRHLDGYVSTVKIGEDGASVVAELKQPAMLRGFVDGNTIAIDIIGERSAAGTPPGRSTKPANAVAEKSNTPLVKEAAVEAVAQPTDAVVVPIRFAEHEGFRRVVFDWQAPVNYTLAENGDVARLRFAHAAALDAARLAAALPGLAPTLRDEDGATIVTLTVPAGTSFRHFRSGNSVVLDVLGAGARLAAKASNGSAGLVPPPELIEPAAGTPADNPQKPFIGAPRPLIRPGASAAPPVPPGALPVRFALAPQGASLRFDWPMPTAAAVFRRGDALWIVFAALKPLDLTEPYRIGGDVLSSITQLPHAKATVLRLVARDGLNPSIRRAENSWIVELKPQAARTDAPIAIEARPSAATPSVFFAIRDAAETLFMRDPEVGDTLAVMPVSEVGRGVDDGQDFVDFRVLASMQGIALRPNADDLRMLHAAGGIEVSRPGGLLLSAETDRASKHPEEPYPYFDFANWGGPSDQTFLQKRSGLEQAVAAAPAAHRSKPRLALARFYFANLFGPEALGVLDAIKRDDPGALGEPPARLLVGAVHLMTADIKNAAQDLNAKALDNEPDATLWRASLAAETADWQGAAHNFALGVNLLTHYPRALRDRFALQAAEAFIKTDQPDEAEPLLLLVLKNDPPMNDKAMALYFEGQRAAQQGNVNQAIELWTQVAGMGDRPSRAQALYARTMARLDANQISRADAIKALDSLRFAWRGDMVEFTLLRQLAKLKVGDGDQRGAFDVMRDAVANFPDYPASKDVMKELSESFTEVFLGKGVNDVSPLKALALYDDFKDYAPAGERGDAIVRRLVDRLVSVDLLDQAAALLDDQVNHRLAGREKARVAAQLALLRLLDHKPDAAIKALDIDVGKDVPPDLAKQRQQLRARALAELNRNDEALAILTNDMSQDADRLRAEIFWRAHNWRDAAKAFSRLVSVPVADGKLDNDSSRIVLNWASALTLAGDQAGLAALRATYGKPMADTAFGDAFRIVAGDPAAVTGETDPRTIANRVAQVTELQSFMTTFKERLIKDKLSDIN